MAKINFGKSKYRAVKTEVDGIMFDSKKEAARYVELKEKLDAGIIQDLKLKLVIGPVVCGNYFLDLK